MNFVLLVAAEEKLCMALRTFYIAYVKVALLLLGASRLGKVTQDFRNQPFQFGSCPRRLQAKDLGFKVQGFGRKQG